MQLKILHQTDLLRGGQELKQVAWLSPRGANSSRWKFNHRMRRQARGKPPRRDTAFDLLDAILAVNINEVDRELHEKCMHRFARNYP